MPIVDILVGALLLFFGRRLFWLFVAGVGFVVGAMLATEWLGTNGDAMNVVIALAVGLISAIASMFLQRLMVAIAGFLAGGYLFHAVAFGLKYESVVWLSFLVGGVIGALLVIALFDWALIALSVLTGTTVIAQNVALERSASALLFLVLLVLGALVQVRQLTRAAPEPEKGGS